MRRQHTSVVGRTLTLVSGILTFKREAVDTVARAAIATRIGFWFLLIPFFVENIFDFYIFGRFYEFGMLTASMIRPIMCIAFVYITFHIAQGYFSTRHHTPDRLFRVLTYAYSLYWVEVIFKLFFNTGMISSVTLQFVRTFLIGYFLAVAFFAVQHEYGLNEQDSIITIIGAIMVAVIVKGFLGFIL